MNWIFQLKKHVRLKNWIMHALETPCKVAKADNTVPFLLSRGPFGHLYGWEKISWCALLKWAQFSSLMPLKCCLLILLFNLCFFSTITTMNTHRIMNINHAYGWTWNSKSMVSYMTNYSSTIYSDTVTYLETAVWDWVYSHIQELREPVPYPWATMILVRMCQFIAVMAQPY